MCLPSRERFPCRSRIHPTMNSVVWRSSCPICLSPAFGFHPREVCRPQRLKMTARNFDIFENQTSTKLPQMKPAKPPCLSTRNDSCDVEPKSTCSLQWFSGVSRTGDAKHSYEIFVASFGGTAVRVKRDTNLPAGLRLFETGIHSLTA